jgi:hypothetical protein
MDDQEEPTLPPPAHQVHDEIIYDLKDLAMTDLAKALDWTENLPPFRLESYAERDASLTWEGARGDPMMTKTGVSPNPNLTKCPTCKRPLRDGKCPVHGSDYEGGEIDENETEEGETSDE